MAPSTVACSAVACATACALAVWAVALATAAICSAVAVSCAAVWFCAFASSSTPAPITSSSSSSPPQTSGLTPRCPGAGSAAVARCSPCWRSAAGMPTPGAPEGVAGVTVGASRLGTAPVFGSGGWRVGVWLTGAGIPATFNARSPRTAAENALANSRTVWKRAAGSFAIARFSTAITADGISDRHCCGGVGSSLRCLFISA